MCLCDYLRIKSSEKVILETWSSLGEKDSSSDKITMAKWMGGAAAAEKEMKLPGVVDKAADHNLSLRQRDQRIFGSFGQ